ncbi:MAG TPA: zinc ABC transporter substrate-binding protein [Leptolyngbyaceae cyanobacterium]
MLKSFSLKTCYIRSAALLALALGFTGCTPSQPTTTLSPSDRTAATQVSPSDSAASNNDKPKVIATTSVLCDIIQEIAQDTVDLKCLIPAGTDSHLYKLKPDDRKAIEQAKLILYAGYDFEPSLIKLIQATKNQAPKVAVNEVAVPKPQQFEEDGKTETDPHVWHNAQNGVRIVETVRDNLGKISPSNAAQYTSNAEKMTSELKQVDSWIKSQISTIPANQRKLVTTHDALGYYSKAYGIPLEGALEGISTEEKPTAKRVKELVGVIKRTGIPMIFAETTINPKLIETVAKEANVKVSDREIFTDGLGEKGTEGDTYTKMLIANTQTIVEGLGGKYTAFRPK